MEKRPDFVSVFVSDSSDVYFNQAVELALFDSVKESEIIMYLWSNDKTVVVGRNQDAQNECRADLLFAEGGKVARRLSGGGAVYHDKGNLNFTFCARDGMFSKNDNFEVVFAALNSCGFNVEMTGRNDLTVSGKKFSGNAYYSDCGKKFQHGTLLIDTDGEALKRYLTPSEEKLKTKGVQSVEARVLNLKSVRPDFNKEKAVAALISAFKNKYKSACFEIIDKENLPRKAVSQNIAFFSDRKWILGNEICYNLQCKTRCAAGLFDIRCFVRGGIVENCKVYSDSLDTSRVEDLENKLKGSFVGSEINGEAEENLLNFVRSYEL